MTVNSIIGSKGNIQSAIAMASRATGIDFDYLLGQAQVESGMNANARAGTSSATGLYQFIDQSWLGVVKQHGAEYGLGWAADSISKSGGRYTVADGATKQAILALRNDPQVASLMAAQSASDNKTALESSTGRAATGTDLYMAHFLGLGGAKNFLSAMASDPDRSGASMFPAAARANRGIFFDASGNTRSLSDIYSRFASKLDRGAVSAGATGLASDALDGSSGATTPLAAQFQLAAAEVVPGNGESGSSAANWAQAQLDKLNGGRTQAASLMRPTPATARLAYMMLASMGA